MLRFVSFVSCALTLAVVVCGMCSSGFCGVSVVEVQQPAQITDMLAHDLLFTRRADSPVKTSRVWMVCD